MTTPPQSATGPGPAPTGGMPTGGMPTGGMSTQEIPVVPGAVPNTQHLPPPPATAAGEGTPSGSDHSTGPVDFVPEPPAPVARATEQRGRRLPGGRAALVPVGLAALAVVVLELGLALPFGTQAFWSTIPLWSAFATAATVVGLAAVAAPALGRARGAAAWRVAAGGLTCLAAFWLLVALPLAASDRGFLLTAALACLGAAVWLTARRPAA